ncbi:MAG: hypothetical protein L0Y64_03870 [Myxococcaceae bacterium]|nr:hypothetical protein [Myxococcaceae bacterium]
MYDEQNARELDGVLLFGDDLVGYSAGFLLGKSWKLIEIGPGDLEELEETFEAFIRRRLEWALEQQ